MEKSVIVYAPQGSGKTLVAESLRQHFGLEHIEEEWDGRHRRPMGVLYLTNFVPTKYKNDWDRRVMSLAEAINCMAKGATLVIPSSSRRH